MATGKPKKSGSSRGRKSGSTGGRRTRREQHRDALVLPPGTEVGEYTLGEVLGRGGFGITYLGKSTSGSNRRLAIKEFFIGQICTRMPGSNEVVLFGNVSAGDRRDFELALEKFGIEYQMIKDADHRSIVEYYDFIEANGTAYLVMEYVQGKTLADWLTQNKRQTGKHVSERKLKGLFGKVLDAVDFLHYRNIMHRDITPANIMIHRRDGKETPKLIDFGTMGEGLDRVRTQSILAHTPEYAAPEQTDPDGKHGAFTDIFALGGVMYRAICGEPPALPHKRERAVQSGKTDPYKPATSKTDDPARYSETFLAGIDKALSLNPDERPQSIQEFQVALNWIAPGTIISEHPNPEDQAGEPPTPPDQPTPRWIKVAAAAIGTVLLMGMAQIMINSLVPKPPTEPVVSSPKPVRSIPPIKPSVPQREMASLGAFFLKGLPSGTRNTGTPNGCGLDCAGKSNCIAYTYKSDSRPNCSLYSRVDDMAPSTSHASGVMLDYHLSKTLRGWVKRYDSRRSDLQQIDKGWAFGDQTLARFSDLNATECQFACLREWSCTAYSYSEGGGGSCQTYSSVTPEQIRKVSTVRSSVLSRDVRRKVNEEIARREGPPPPPPPPPDKLIFASYYGVDFFGNDLDARPGQYERTSQSCMSACQRRYGCNAFTFNTSTGPGIRNCFLKSGTGIKEANPDAVSGLFFKGQESEAETFHLSLLPADSLERNVDYFGGDLPGQPEPLPRATATHCRLACIGRSDCVAFTYVSRLGQCWLKGYINQRRTGGPGRGKISGVKRGTQSIAPSNVSILSARN